MTTHFLDRGLPKKKNISEEQKSIRFIFSKRVQYPAGNSGNAAASTECNEKKNKNSEKI